MKSLITIFLFFLFAVPLLGQNEWHFSSITSLQQLNKKEAEESLPLFDSKNNQLYFVRTNDLQNQGGQDIWMSQWLENKWQKAKHLPYPINTFENEAVVAIHDNTLIIWRGLTLAGENLNKFYLVKYTDTTYQQPAQLSFPQINTRGNYMGVYLNQKGNLIIASLNNHLSEGEEDLFVIRQNEQGNWMQPLSLGNEINTSGFEISPFLLADEKTLFFASNGRNDSEGSDLYFSTRKNKWNEWTTPKKVSGINSKSFDAYFYYDETNKKAYWTSNRNNQKADIFMADLAKPDRSPANIATANNNIKYDEPPEFLGLSEEKLSTKKAGDVHIYFEKDASDLQPEMKKLLQMLAKQIDKYNNFSQLIIRGFADDTGTEYYNLRLSEKRAVNVKNYLVKLGFPVANLTIEPMGEIESNSNDAMSRKLNRRVDIIVNH